MQPIDNRKSPGCSRLPVGRSLRVLLLCAALSLFGLPPLVFAQSYTWKSVVTPAGGTITGIVYSLAAQGLIYARTDMGGSYRWDNTNKVWIPLTDWLGDWNLYGVDSIAADPKNANNVYAAIGQSYSGTTGSIIASTNQGAAWTQYPIAVTIAGNNGGNNAGERLAVDPNLTSTLYFGTRYNGLWKSTNSAATWSRVASFPVNGDSGNGLSWVVIDPHGTSGSASATIYVGVEAVGSGNSNVYRSTDGGANWSVIPGGPTSMITVQGSLGSDGTLWMSYNDSTNYQTGQIWKLNTATLGWSNVSPSNGPGSGAGGYSGVCVDAQNAQHAMVTTIDWWGGPDKCFQTTNGGGAWNVIANTQNSWDSGPFPVYNNNGVTWTRFCGPYDGGAWYMNCMKIDPFNSNNAIYTTGGGLWSSANILASVQPAGVTWTFTDYGIEQTAVLFLNAASKAGTFFSALGDISGMRYTDITKPAPTNYCNPAFGNTFCLDFAENSPNNVARVGASNAVTSDTAFSTDNGQTWAPGTSAPPGYTTTQQLRTVAVAADGSRVIVCPNSGYGNPAYTSNRGGAWTTCNGLPSGSDLAADRTNATTIYATNGGTLYRSVDTGGNFTAVNSFTGSGVPRAVFGVAGEVWVATGNGLFRFTNGGSTAATIANVSSANSVGFGKAASGQTHPAVYLTGNVGGTYGFYRCDDGTGATWMRINDNNHQYGYGAWCGGDEAIYGRVYVGTNGRGVVYGDLVATTPIPTSTLTTTSTSTPTATLTFSSTATRTTTVTPSRTATSTPTSTSTLTKTSTPTSSVTGTATPTRTDTASATATPSPTATPTSTRTYTPTSTPTQTPFNTSTYTPSLTSTTSQCDSLQNPHKYLRRRQGHPLRAPRRVGRGRLRRPPPRYR
jgi:xyloglucan-specific exo-beta-1,4-glucanase